jgi:guanine nucleotide-binding protein alpha-1 subunit
VDAIIFLAPLVFDQYLEEAPNVNRLKDTIEIWKHVCGNKLLQRATLVLFLNKMDVLERTLIDGVRVKDYIPAYEGANELAPVVACACSGRCLVRE